MTTELETPVGQLVWGHPGKAQTKKDQRTKAVILKDGKPVEQWVFGIAFSIADFEQRIWPAMAAEIATGYPQGIPSNFSFKYKDGRTNDRNGKPYAGREGYAGCYVLTVSTEAFAPPVYKWEATTGKYRQMSPEEYKCGDYFTIKTNFKVNVPADRTHTPGLFVNPVGLLHVAYGKEIITTGGDPTEMFGAQPQQHQLPPGASMTPLAPSPGVQMPGPSGSPPNGYPQPAPGYAPPGDPRFTGGPPPMQPAPQYQPAPQQQYQPAPQQQYQPAPGGYTPPVQPAHDFVQNAGHQPPNGQPQYQPPGQPQYQPAPGGYAPPAPNGQHYAPPPGMPSQQMPGMPPNR